MMMPKRQPVSPGKILNSEFLAELSLSQQAVADLMGVSRKTVNELINDKQRFTIDIALLLEKVFDTPPEFWLNLQRQTDLWNALNSQSTKARIAKAKRYRGRKKNKENAA
jgi:addiction module HigA family antidote